MKTQYGAYTKATHTAPKTRQVVMLYDGAIRSISQAKEAVEKGDIQLKFNKLVNAGDIIMGLQASLDLEAGGDVAKALYDYYATIDARIIKLHRSKDSKGYDMLSSELKQLRNEWYKIDNGDTEKSEAEQHIFSEATEYSVPSEPSMQAQMQPQQPPAINTANGLTMSA